MRITPHAHHRNHQNSLEIASENEDGLPAARKDTCTTSRQALNHMSTAAGGGIFPASAGKRVERKTLEIEISDDSKP